MPRELHGQRSLAGYSPWGPKESYTTEQLTHSLSAASLLYKTNQTMKEIKSTVLVTAMQRAGWFTWITQVNTTSFPTYRL